MHRLLLLVLLVAGFYSCVPHKKIIYFQDGSVKGDTFTRPKFNYRIQPRDRLIIKVSSYNSKVTDFFNLSPSTTGGAGAVNIAQSPLFNYWVNDSGFVDIPMFNAVEVKGLTIEECRLKIQDFMREQVPDAYVIVRLANFQVTILGETNQAAVIETQKDFLSIYEALSQAGDINFFGNKSTVKLIRNAGDSSQVFTLDLTKKDLLASEYYYLQPNDIVYVERLKVRTFLDNLNTVSRIVGIATIVILANQLVNIIAN
jgi:polysaccharide export outer membrane protein